MSSFGAAVSKSKSTTLSMGPSASSRASLEQEIALIKERISYDPATGLFTHLLRGKGPQKRFEPGCAGTHDSRGYIQLGLNGKLYRAHRVAFVLMLGRFPNKHVDHINGVRDDNRWRNLREATASQNHMNQRKRAGATSKFKGVSWNARRSKWVAQIKRNRKVRYLGLFDNEETAHEAYREAAKQLHEEFANVG